MSESKDLRWSFSHFVTGVTIVSAQGPDGELIGVTANSFSSVSLDPPLVQINLARSLRSFEALARTPSFAINLLSKEQHELCMRFARPGADKWAGIAPEFSPQGNPLIPGRLAHFDCRSWARYDGGDHLILVGEVTDHFSRTDAQPLIFYQGALQSFDLKSPVSSKENSYA